MVSHPAVRDAPKGERLVESGPDVKDGPQLGVAARRLLGLLGALKLDNLKLAVSGTDDYAGNLGRYMRMRNEFGQCNGF